MSRFRIRISECGINCASTVSRSDGSFPAGRSSAKKVCVCLCGSVANLKSLVLDRIVYRVSNTKLPIPSTEYPKP